ncbi:MAG: type II toxin-antitoxin system HicA family toxin [Bryobacteraceae bacterium]|jgi:predicted RNA binding protein YcfA (HicA-like mRNA interferase family)
MTMKVRDVIRLLESNGWRFARQNGTNHRQFVKPGVAKTITVVGEGGDDVGAGLLGKIPRDAGLKGAV